MTVNMERIFGLIGIKNLTLPPLSESLNTAMSSTTLLINNGEFSRLKEFKFLAWIQMY